VEHGPVNLYPKMSSLLSFSSVPAVHSFSANKSLDVSTFLPVMTHFHDNNSAMVANMSVPTLAAKWLAHELKCGDHRFFIETTNSPFVRKYQGWPANTQNKTPFICHFDDSRPPRVAISSEALESFIHRIQNETAVSSNSLVAAIAYIQQLTLAHPHFFVYSRNVSRLLTSAIATASRLHDVSPCADQVWVNLRGLDRCDLEVDSQFFASQQNQFREMLGDSFRALSAEDISECIQKLQSNFLPPHVSPAPSSKFAPVFTVSDSSSSSPVFPSPKMSPKFDPSMPDFFFSKSSPALFSFGSPKMDMEDFNLTLPMDDGFTFELDDSMPVDMGVDTDMGGIHDYIAEVTDSKSSPLLEHSSSVFLPIPSLSQNTSPVVESKTDPAIPEAKPDAAMLVAQALFDEDEDADAKWADCSALPDHQPTLISLPPPPRPLPIPQFTSIYSVDDFRQLPSAQRPSPPSSAFSASAHANFRPLPIPSTSSIVHHSWQFARQLAAVQHAQQKRFHSLPQTTDGFFPNLL
jgi:hypothetical protein